MNRLSNAAVLAVFLVLLAWGAFARLWDLGGRPFWRDEASVAHAALTETCGELLRQTKLPLPPLFAVATKLAAGLRAAHEAGLRLLPALFGIALVPLVYFAARALRAPRSLALAGMALCATSLTLTASSRELSYRQVEACCGVLLALLVFRIYQASPGWQRATAYALLVVCAVAPWLSYSVIFVLLPLLAVLLFLRPAGHRRGTVVAWGLAGLLVTAASFVAVMICAGAAQESNEALRTFWKIRYIRPADLLSWMKAAGWLAQSTFLLLFPGQWWPSVGGQALGGVVIWAVALLGLLKWPGRGRAALAIWAVGPIVLMAVAAVAGRYPFGPLPFVVLWAPALLLLVAAGVVHVCRYIASAAIRRPGPGVILGLVCTTLPVLYVARIPLSHAYVMYHDYPSALKVLERYRQPGELVVIAPDAVAGVRFYAPAELASSVYYPTAGGAFRVPGYDYERLSRATLDDAGPRWWLLCVNPQLPEPVLRDLLEASTQRSYRLEVVAQGRANDPLGGVYLCLLSRLPE